MSCWLVILFFFLSIISNRSWTLPFENNKNIVKICLSPDSNTVITVDEGEHNCKIS